MGKKWSIIAAIAYVVSRGIQLLMVLKVGAKPKNRGQLSFTNKGWFEAVGYYRDGFSLDGSSIHLLMLCFKGLMCLALAWGHFVPLHNYVVCSHEAYSIALKFPCANSTTNTSSSVSCFFLSCGSRKNCSSSYFYVLE